ncbi:MAG: flagellar hook-basal body complex protein [Candidatus Sericytochromatia bacterium]
MGMISAAAMEAFKYKIEIIANNISNAHTDGFKKSDITFYDHIYGYSVAPNETKPTGKSTGKGLKIGGTNTVDSQGSIKATEDSMDLAINGKGFFRFLHPSSNQVMYSRNGKFKIDDQGRFVNSNGYLLDPAITLTADQSFSHVSEDGRVWASQGNNKVLSQVGNLQITAFPNPAGLQSIGDSMYVETSASGAAITSNPKTAALGSIVSGAVETSNVSIVREMMDLVKTQKDYDSNAQVITAEGKMANLGDLIK